MKKRALFTTYRIQPLPTRLPTRILDLLTWLWYLGLLVGDELRPSVRLSAAYRWRAWRHGFSSQSYVVYRLNSNDPGDYLSDYAQTKAHRINDPFNVLFRNKLLFSYVMARLDLAQPRVRGLLQRGRIWSLDGAMLPDRLEEGLPRLLDGGDSLVFRPTLGGGGTGVVFLSRSDGAFAINGVNATLADVCALLSRLNDYLLTDFVRQAEYAARVYPRTTNTVRILTLWDRPAGAPFIAAAAHRFGTATSFPVDSWHRGRGGLCAKIDLATGELGPGATLSAEGRLCWYERHPASDAPIQGVRVPFWPETKATILRVAERLPYAPAIGWDLVITDTGCCCLEGNSPPSPSVWQVHQPLLRDPRARRFYQEHGII